jgi:hypothetical protein
MRRFLGFSIVRIRKEKRKEKKKRKEKDLQIFIHDSK